MTDSEDQQRARDQMLFAFDYTTATPESIRTFMTPVFDQLQDGDSVYIANALADRGRAQALVALRDQFGVDVTPNLTYLLEWGLLRKKEDEMMTLDGEERPLRDQVRFLLEHGANPSKIKGWEGLVDQLAFDQDDIRAMMKSHASGVNLDPLARHASGAGATEPIVPDQVVSEPVVSDQVRALRQASGQDWRQDSSGKAYLELPDAQTVCDVSGTLSRFGVRQSYGWPGVMEGKTAVVIPAGVLEDMTDSDVRNAGQAVGNLLGIHPASPSSPPAVGAPGRIVTHKPPAADG